MDIFDLIRPAERIKNVDQAIVGFVGVVLGASSLPALPQGELFARGEKERAEAVKDRLSRANELRPRPG